MSKPYVADRDKLYTAEGFSTVLEVERKARQHIAIAGAVRCDRMLVGDSWACLNALDLLEERKVLRQVTDPDKCAGQDRVYVAGDSF